MSILCANFFLCVIWPWLDPYLTTIQCVAYIFPFFVDDVMFSFLNNVNVLSVDFVLH